MTLSAKTLIAVALAPIAVYCAIMVATFAVNPSHFPGGVFAIGGAVVAVVGPAYANALRIYRDRKPRA